MSEVLPPLPPSIPGATFTLPCDPSSAPAARRHARDALRDCPRSLVDVVELLVSEIVSNALVHARSACHMRIEASRGSGVQVEVRDTAPAHAELREPSTDGDCGRGLLLVDALADSWGCAPVPGGKVVWFEVRP